MVLFEILIFLLIFILGIIGWIKLDTLVEYYIKIGYTHMNSAGRKQQPEWFIRLGIKWFLFFAVLVGFLGVIASIRDFLGLGPIKL